MVWLLLVIVLTLLFLLYTWLSQIYSYWDVRGIPGPRPLPLLGNMLNNITGDNSFGELCLQWSREFQDAPLLGVFNFVKPFLVVQKLEYVETVLIKEFSHFADRAPPPPSKVNLSDQFLFIATGTTWRALRTKLAPVFTTGKLKGMVRQMKLCFNNTSEKINDSLGKDVVSDDFIQTYIIDATANIVFGIESSSLSDPDSEFRKMSEKMFQFNLKRFVSFVLYFVFPKLAGILKIPFVPTEQTEYFKKVLDETFKQRKAAGVKRNDVVQLLLELKEKGRVDVDTWDAAEDGYLELTELNKATETIDLTDDLLTSQAMIFLTTGFDTMSTALTFTLVELCQNQQAMDTLVEEIHSVLAVHKDFTYQALKDMKYLEMCLMEGMRLHPAVPAFLRYCTKSYTFDNWFHVEKGTMLVVPVLSIHMNPDIYPRPDEFRPERFAVPPKPASYLPFGDGPRICIAKRFAMLEMKMMLARLLRLYRVQLSPSTKLPVSTEKWNFLSKPNSPVYFKFNKINPS